MSSKKFLFAAFLLALAAFAIPIEHKYDKLFRYYSLTLIPNGLELPAVFDKKIYFYASDLIAVFLLCTALFWFRIPLRKFFTERSAHFLWIVFGCSFASICASPFAHYPIPYIRLLQLLTPVVLFSFIANAFNQDEKEKITRFILLAIVAAALFQASVATLQYLHQDWLGLRILSEQKLSACIGVPEGKLGLFDPWIRRIAKTNLVMRASGTLPHPNVLGGFMALSILASYSLIFDKSFKWRKWIALILPVQFFALGISFSRSAIYACAIGTLIWFGWMIWKKRNARLIFPVLLIGFSIAATGILLFEPFARRGGIVGSYSIVQPTDGVRVYYQNVALKMIEKNPFLGVGFHQFSLRSKEYLPPDTPNAVYSTATHNIYLLLGAETGLISLAAFILFIGTILRAALRTPATPQLASLIAIFIAFLFIGGCDFYPILFQQGKLMFFMTAGLLAAQGNFEKKKSAVPMETGSI